MNKTFKKTIEFRHLFYLEAFFFNLPIHSFCKGDILQTKKIRSHWSSHIITYWSVCSKPEVSFLLKLFLDPLTEAWPHTAVIPRKLHWREPVKEKTSPAKYSRNKASLHVVEPTAALLHYWVIKVYFIFTV